MTKQRKQDKIFSTFLMLVTLLLWIFERATSILSDTLGEWWYKSKYMQPINGYLGDRSYGFNTDMYLSLLFIVLFIFGMLLYIRSRKE